MTQSQTLDYYCPTLTLEQKEEILEATAANKDVSLFVNNQSVQYSIHVGQVYTGKINLNISLNLVIEKDAN